MSSLSISSFFSARVNSSPSSSARTLDVHEYEGFRTPHRNNKLKMASDRPALVSLSTYPTSLQPAKKLLQLIRLHKDISKIKFKNVQLYEIRETSYFYLNCTILPSKPATSACNHIPSKPIICFDFSKPEKKLSFFF